MNDGLGYGEHVLTVRYGHLPLLDEQICQRDRCPDIKRGLSVAP